MRAYFSRSPFIIDNKYSPLISMINYKRIINAFSERLVATCLHVRYSLEGMLRARGIRRQFVDAPIIIGGCGRSGTTLLLSILSAHPDIYAIPIETGSFITREPRRLYPGLKMKLNYFYGTNFKNVPKIHRRWCEKTPSNVQHFDKLLDKFNGNVKLVHIIRDGRDVTLSTHPTDKLKYWVEPERWIHEVKKGLEYRNHDNVYTIKYEDIINNYDREIKSLCSFLDLKEIDTIIDWHENTTVRSNRAWAGEVKPLFTGSVEKWRNPKYESRVKQFMQNEEAVELLMELDYQV